MSKADDIDWNRLDRTKFLVMGAGLFSGVTLTLFPLSVIKTRQMAMEPRAPTGLSGAAQVARDLWRHEGLRGLYKGFGTVVIGILPARMIYLTTLESVKTYSMGTTSQVTGSEAGAAAAANFVAGGTASLVTQSVIVPVDVVSQRLMVAGGTAASASMRSDARLNGLQIARQVIQREGVRGLYRGFGLSVVTFVPSSAVWWSAYGGYQKSLWQLYDDYHLRRGHEPQRGAGALLGVQTASSCAAGLTSACLTNPFDVIKTRLQVAEREAGGGKPTFMGTARQLIAEDGARGLLRGLVPRMVNVALWGTAMVTCYEFLKRNCALPADDPETSDNTDQLALS